MKNPKILTLLSAVVCVVFLVACATPTPTPVPTKPSAPPAVPTTAPVTVPTTAPAPTAPKATTPRVLRMILGEPNVGIDPSTASTALSMAVMEMIHDPLVERDEKWKAIPWIAQSWKANEDSSQWTFTLRDGIKFSDGSPITADDVKFSFDRMAAAALWKTKMAVVKSVQVPDKKTVVFQFSRPLPEFLDLPGPQVGYFIVSKAACENKCDFGTPGTPVSGPWILKEWVVKSKIVLEKNPYYGFEGFPKFDRVEISLSDDRTAAAAGLEAGTIDFTQPLNAPDAALLMKNPNVKVYRGQRVDQLRGFGLDKTRPPFSDKRVRQAIGYLTEPQESVDTCWYGLSNPLWGGIFYDIDTEWAPLLARNPWKKPRQERLDLANRLLTDAGWRDDNKDGVREAHGVAGVPEGTPFSVTVNYESGWVQAECHTLLMQQWAKGTGIKLNPERVEKAVFNPDAAAGKFQMWHAGAPASPIPWEKIQSWFQTQGAIADRVGRVRSPELDAQINTMLNETNMDKKKKLLSDLADYLADEQFYIATGSQDSLYGSTAKMVGFYPTWNISNRALLRADIPGR